MSEYWVSNDRKYCDFCKCYIADNKPSIQFHEGGKRHKENVAKRLEDISRQSAKDERSQQKVDQQMRQMEDAAARAYEADIASGADMTSRAIAAFVGGGGGGGSAAAGGDSAASAAAAAAASASSSSGIGPHFDASASGDTAAAQRGHRSAAPGPAAFPKRAVDPLMPPAEFLAEEERERRERQRRRGIRVLENDRKADEREPPPSENSMWCEAKSEEGHTYYWNVKSNETVWEEPKEGFMTLQEYERINEVALKQQSVKQAEEAAFMRGNADEIVAKYAREKLKERRVKPSPAEKAVEEEKREEYAPFEDPETEARPLGKWQSVAPATATDDAPQHVDLQLPHVVQDYVYVAAANVVPEPPVKKFREKVVTTLASTYEQSLGDAAPANEFKKRKGVAAKRNMRQRHDDD